ncbi:hypothetical protein HanRHA438_Chr16g0769381 [Helianthus annuus]|nr:hypothetical protein HanRHA438_Chr16g0769381 [Helianthus annuus]
MIFLDFFYDFLDFFFLDFFEFLVILSSTHLDPLGFYLIPILTYSFFILHFITHPNLVTNFVWPILTHLKI